MLRLCAIFLSARESYSGLFDLCFLPSLEKKTGLKLKAPEQLNLVSQVLHFIKHKSKTVPAWEPI